MTDAPRSMIKRAAVIGCPISHSLSPRIFDYWLKKYGIDGQYHAIEVKPQELSRKLDQLKDQGYCGLNVTLPHKESVIEYLDEIHPDALRIGAVNKVTFACDGRLIGTNTDGYGFIHNLKDDKPDWRGDLGPVVVLGAGGAARAIIAALQSQNVPEIRLVNRSLQRAEKLVHDLNLDASPTTLKIYSWENASAVLRDATLLVNTTSLGMVGQDPLVLSLDMLPVSCLVADIVYKPLHTDLLRQAQTRGNPIVTGIGMLVHQAVPGFEDWFGRTPKVTDELMLALTIDRP